MGYYLVWFVEKFISKTQTGSQTKKDETIHIDILSKHFYDTIKIKKNQEIAYIFLVNQKSLDKLVTLYSNYISNN